MRPDPPVREDGLCAVCLQPRQELTPRHRRYGGISVLLDPFCSRKCLDAWQHAIDCDLDEDCTCQK